MKEKGAVVQAIERAIAIQSQEEVKREFMWQKTKGEDKKADFENELLVSYAPAPDIKVCAFVQKYSASSRWCMGVEHVLLRGSKRVLQQSNWKDGRMDG